MAYFNSKPTKNKYKLLEIKFNNLENKVNLLLDNFYFNNNLYLDNSNKELELSLIDSLINVNINN